MSNLSINQEALILAYEKGYRVENGNVISCRNKIVKLGKDTTGYFVFYFRFPAKIYKRKTINIKVHRLVAYQKFGKKIFEDGVVVRHLDGNKLNNLDENIGIGSQSDNMMDKTKEARLQHSLLATVKNRKFTDEQIKLIREDHKIHKMTYPEIMKKWEITSKSSLSYMINNEYKTKKS